MFVIGIAGGSGSGKTTFAKKIIGLLTPPFREAVALLHQDSYYLPPSEETLALKAEHNFDHPEAFDWDLLKSHLRTIRAGGSIEAPIYDFKMSGRSAQTERIGPCEILIFEGIYALWDTEIRDILNLKIYLHIDSDIRFIRRLHRDVKERARTLDMVIHRYYSTVRPMHRQFLEPTSQYADLIVGEETDTAATVIAAQINQQLTTQESSPSEAAHLTRK